MPQLLRVAAKPALTLRHFKLAQEVCWSEGRVEATHTNHVWTTGFVHDQLATGRKLRFLTIVNTFSLYGRCRIKQDH